MPLRTAQTLHESGAFFFSKRKSGRSLPSERGGGERLSALARAKRLRKAATLEEGVRYLAKWSKSRRRVTERGEAMRSRYEPKEETERVARKAKRRR